ncbi:MAG: magnesium transporter [Acidobacteria bacterium]|nr:magnesium transporter [Acidobacteriota bacterium]
MVERRHAVILESVRRFMRRSAYNHLLNLLRKTRPQDFGPIYDELPEREQLALFKLLASREPEIGAEFLVELTHGRGPGLLAALEPESAARLLEKCAEDDSAELLAALDEEQSARILEAMKPEEKASVEKLLIYEEETAGRIMTLDVFSLPEDMTIREAISALQARSQEVEMAFYLYVVDDRNHLVGVLSLRELLLHPPETPLKEIMNTDLITVRTDTDQEEVARVTAKYDLMAMPVVDQNGRLAGMVTIDDVVDVLREEATEDILRIAGTSEEERIEPSIGKSVRMRSPWLLATFLGGLAASVVINGYAGTLQQMVGLAAFIPIVLNMGGSVGTQSAIVIIRGLATGRVREGLLLTTFLREVGVAAVLGFGYGLLLVLGSYAALVLRGQAAGALAVTTGIVIGASLALSMMLATLMGVTIPLLLHRLGIDPALSTTPFVTTTMDVVGSLIFLSLATLIIL